MQLVSREVLFDIMKHKHNVVLKESDSAMFQDFKDKAKEEFQAARIKSDNDRDLQMKIFYGAMVNFMFDNMSQVRYVGTGSSRTVFAMADGTALKLAKNMSGIAQNKQETANCMDPMMKYQIFPDFYGADTSDYLSLNCELCTKAEAKDFKEILNAQPIAIGTAIEYILENIDQPTVFNDALKYFYDGKDFGSYNVVKAIAEDGTAMAKALKSLLQFYAKHGRDELLFDDLARVTNWGLTVRDSQKVLVIIDAGFSENVFQDYYSNIQ